MKITLCGSTKYRDAFNHANRVLSKAGHIVYSVASFGHHEDDMTDEDKIILDLVHFRKIVESDAILVVGGDGLTMHESEISAFAHYIGFSTRREIAWAKMWGKPIYGGWRRALSVDCDVFTPLEN
ncbi:hypothetical protein CcrColossus_gp148 [Caulobacter phage CcrColossus]|uniref:Uncharacterized protein n=1 Tax=Caulobacter phage CcrColossus TaxID=1211640 RepID=K4JVX4_9CAUD|nr:hypothetical protein CcrColossus_gp148 [Caulobacter phage CcrColossus]AFU88018.1 hypothetical protein CcrColossus_gp148 [Caulobacter phage CcrColossus]